MNNMGANKPQIRFKGFSEEWDRKRMGDLSNITFGGGTPMTSVEKFWNGNIPWLQSSDLTENQVLNIIPRKYITEEAIKKSAAKLVPQNSVAIVTRVGVGKIALIDYSYTTSQDFLSLSNLNIEIFFSVYLFYRLMQCQRNDVQGTSIKGITKEELLNQSLYISKYKEEQTKIGIFFKQLDQLISLRQRKYDKLLNLKQALLEKFFPQNGANKPQIRFKGFSEEWERKKLGDVSNLLTGYPFESKLFVKSGTLLIRGMNVKRNYLDLSPDICEYWIPCNNLNEYLLKDGDIVIQMDGALIGKSYARINKIHLPALLVQRVTRVRSNGQEIIDNNFIYQAIQRDFLQYIMGIKTETAVPHLSSNDIYNFNIMTPRYEEQTKIGQLFQTIDRLINLHQQELSKLKNIKQACLEKMFV